MKISVKIWFVISFLLVLISLYGVFNTRVSLTYEVYEPLAMGKITDALKEKEELYKTTLFWLWVIIGYVSMNVMFITVLLKSMKEKFHDDHNK